MALMKTTAMCDSFSSPPEFFVAKLYICAATVGPLFGFSTSLNGCVVIVRCINLNFASSLPENKLTASLQACAPSSHVCSVLGLPLVPHFSNQAPSGAQQLDLPDFLMTAHLEHTGAVLVAVPTGVDTHTHTHTHARTHAQTERERLSSNTSMQVITVNCQLTFAGPQAFDPRVLDVCVATASTHLKPSAAGSATTISA